MQTFSLTIGGVSQHLISYYKIEDVENGRLRCPSSLPELASLDISPEYLDKQHFRNPPKVEIGVDGLPRYRGEADIEDGSPTMLSAPLSSGVPLLKSVNDVSGSGKRGKRYDPYGNGTPKRSRKSKNAPNQATPQADQEPTPATQPQPQPLVNSTQQPQPAVYADPSVPGIGHPHYSPYGIPPYYQMPPYPPPHVYSPNPYPQQTGTPSPTAQQAPQTSQTSQPQSQQQYPYTYTPPATNGIDPQQTAQQPYQYPYYPPAPHGYPGYPPGVAWPYSGYPPPQPALQPANNNAVTSTTEFNDKSPLAEDRDADGVENGPT